MNRLNLSFLIALLLLGAFTLGLSGQVARNSAETILAQIQPLLVDIQQQVPVSVTLAVPVGTTGTQTVTVPLMLDLNLQIQLADTVTATVNVAEKAPVVVSVHEVTEPSGEKAEAAFAAATDSSLTVDVGQVQNIEGVLVELQKVDLERYSQDVVDEVKQWSPGYAYLLEEEQPPVVGFLTLIVTNTSGTRAHMRLIGEGYAIVGTEQAKLSYWWSEDLDGAIFPGVVKQGRAVFQLGRTELDELKNGFQLQYRANGPSSHQNLLGQDWYEFVLQISEVSNE